MPFAAELGDILDAEPPALLTQGQDEVVEVASGGVVVVQPVLVDDFWGQSEVRSRAAFGRLQDVSSAIGSRRIF